jgi:hypothetical protein
MPVLGELAKYTQLPLLSRYKLDLLKRLLSSGYQ